MRKSSVLLSVVAVASAAVSVSLWMELRAERARNAELSARLDAAGEVRTVSVSEAPQVRKPAITPLPAVDPESDGAPGYSSQLTQEEEDLEAAERRHLRDPKYREAWREERRLARAWLREDLIKLVGFTPQQADKVIDLSIDGQLRGLERTDSSLAEDEAAEVAHQAKLREVLGADGVARLQAYYDSRPTRNQVNQLRNELTGVNVLRDDQVEPLIAAMQAERAQMERELAAISDAADPNDISDATARKYAEIYAEQLQATHGRMHSSAAAILSRSQLETLDTMLRRERERNDAVQRMSRIQSTLDTPGDAATPPD